MVSTGCSRPGVEVSGWGRFFCFFFLRVRLSVSFVCKRFFERLIGCPWSTCIASEKRNSRVRKSRPPRGATQIRISKMEMRMSESDILAGPSEGTLI